MSALFSIVLSLLAIFLILLVLVQRGRGGGLAGALGGMGGSSAFGAKAGDVFTRITIVTAAIWIAVSLTAVFWANHRGDALSTGSRASQRAADTAGGTMPLGGANQRPATETPNNDTPPAATEPTKSGTGAATPPSNDNP